MVVKEEKNCKHQEVQPEKDMVTVDQNRSGKMKGVLLSVEQRCFLGRL